MSIPFMSDVSLKSMNGNTFYVRTQDDFDRIMRIMQDDTYEVSDHYAHIVIYPLGNEEPYVFGEEEVLKARFLPLVHCLIEGVGKPSIRVRSMTTTTNNGSISLKGLDIQIQPYEEGDPTTILENFSKIEDCDISINLGGYLYGSTTAGLFTKCNNISNITITSNRSLLGFILFYQCNGLSNIKEALTTPPPSHQRYVECTRVEASCPGAVIYNQKQTSIGTGTTNIHYVYRVDYTAKKVECDWVVYNDDETTTVILDLAQTQTQLNSSFPFFPLLNTFVGTIPNGTIVGWAHFSSGETTTVYYYSASPSLRFSSSMPVGESGTGKFVISFT